MKPVTPQEVLEYHHMGGIPEKISVVSSKPVNSSVSHWEAPAVVQAATKSSSARLTLEMDTCRRHLIRRFKINQVKL